MVGNTPNYDKIDVLRCFVALKGNPSRASLMQLLSLGEGTVRSILDNLKEKGLIESSKKGHALTAKGEKIFSQIKAVLGMPKPVEVDEIDPGSRKISLLLKDYDKDMKIDYKLRDHAVRNGADGALIFKFEKELFLPNSEYRADFSYLQDKFDLEEENVLVVGFAKELADAERGALAVALEMSPKLSSLLSRIG